MRVYVREREAVIKTHSKLLKFARARIESESTEHFKEFGPQYNSLYGDHFFGTKLYSVLSFI